MRLSSDQIAEPLSVHQDGPEDPAPPPSTETSRLSVGDILRAPLPALGFVDRQLIRAIMVFARRQVRVIHGLENLLNVSDPLILAFNHSIRRETVLVTGALVFYRGGRRVHIWTNWIYRMIPGVGWMLRRAGTIAVNAKPPRLKFLKRFRRFYLKPQPAIEQARDLLLAGSTFGVFPEGRLSPDPRRMLPGRIGMARLSLETGVTVVPIGMRFPGADLDGPIPEDAVMDVHIGPPLRPPEFGERMPSPAASRDWHATIMTEIAQLSGKSWTPRGAGIPDEAAPVDP